MKKFKIMLSVFMVVVIILISIMPAFADTTENNTFINGDLGDRMESVFLSHADMATNTGTLPSSYDLSTSSSFPSVGFQGYGIGSCSAWATTYYQFGYHVATMNGWDSKNDPTKHFSPKFTYNIANKGQNIGSYKDDIYEILRTSGAVRYSEFVPLTSQGNKEYLEICTNTEALRNALKYRVSSYTKHTFATGDTPITSPNDIEIKTIKQKLVDGYVLAFSTDFDAWDYQLLTSRDGSSHIGEDVCIKQYDPNGSDTINDGHAMCIVGYDDNIKYDLNQDGQIQEYEQGALKIVNSYGTDWCNDGYVWVMYDAINRKSNDDIQNVEWRNPIIDEYAFFTIEVDEYPCELIAEVTMTNTNRKNICIGPGISSLTSNSVQFFSNSFINYLGGDCNYNGVEQTIQTVTIPFDYGILVSHPHEWCKYYISLYSQPSTVISRTKIIDSSGKLVVDDANERTIRNQHFEYGYAIGLVGDVDNNGTITTSDVTRIQYHIAQIRTLTDMEFKVADVDKNGKVNTSDVSHIQRVIANIEDGFLNGVYQKLD